MKDGYFNSFKVCGDVGQIRQLDNNYDGQQSRRPPYKQISVVLLGDTLNFYCNAQILPLDLKENDKVEVLGRLANKNGVSKALVTVVKKL